MGGRLSLRPGSSLPALALFLLSCSGSVTTFIELPSTFGSASIIAVSLGQRRVLAFAQSGDQPEPVYFVHEKGLFLLLYDQSLSDLGLEPGQLDLPQSSCALLSPAQTYRSVLRAEEIDWVKEPVLPEELAPVLVADPRACDPCRLPLETTLIPIPSGRYVMAAPLEDRRVLLGTSLGDLVTVSPDLEVKPMRIEPELRVVAACLRPDGDLWLLDLFENLLRGRVEGDRIRATHTSTGTGGGFTKWVATGSTAEELYVLGKVDHGSASFRRLDVRRRRSESLAEWATERPDFGGIIWTEETGALAVGIGEENVFRHTPEEGLVEETLPLSSLGGFAVPSSIGLIPGLGPVVGVGSGRYLRRDPGGSWELMEQDEEMLGPNTRRIAPLELGSFVAVGDRGDIQRYVTGRGFCPRRSTFASANVTPLVPFEDGLMFAGSSEASTDYVASAVFIRRPPPPASD